MPRPAVLLCLAVTALVAVGGLAVPELPHHEVDGHTLVKRFLGGCFGRCKGKMPVSDSGSSTDGSHSSNHSPGPSHTSPAHHQPSGKGGKPKGGDSGAGPSSYGQHPAGHGPHDGGHGGGSGGGGGGGLARQPFKDITNTHHGGGR